MAVVPSLILGFAGWTIFTGILNRVLGATGREELGRLKQAIRKAEAPKMMLNPLVQQGIRAEMEEGIEERWGTDPQELAMTTTRVRSGALDRTIPRIDVGHSPYVEKIAAQVGMSPSEILARVRPPQVGGNMSLGQAVFEGPPS